MHDFVNNHLFVTPSAHRLMQKLEEIVDTESRLKTCEDQTFVSFRPKQQFGSSASVFDVRANGYLYRRTRFLLSEKQKSQSHQLDHIVL